jgi:hypothetical protein
MDNSLYTSDSSWCDSRTYSLEEVKGKENKYPIVLSALTFIGATALTFAAFVILIANNFRLER